MKAQKVHIESTPDQKQADDLQEKTLKTLHPDVRLAEEEKLKHRKKLRNLGAKIYFKDDVNNTKNSMMKGSVNSGALNNACDFEMVSMEEWLQLPLSYDCLQTGYFETPCFQCSGLQRLDQTHFQHSRLM